MSTQATDSKKCSPTNLSRQFGLYSIAAAVAGVSMLALAEPGAAEVVVTKKTIPIPMVPNDMPDPVKISLANNGVDNFSFNLRNYPANSGHSSSFRALTVGGASSHANAIFAGTFNTYTPALPRGSKIGASATFSPVECIVEDSLAGPQGSFRGFRGYWGGNPKNHYVGVRFSMGGKTHYGWIRLTVTTDTNPHGPAMSASITGYAYETVPNKPILAGTPEAATATADKPAAELQAPINPGENGGPSLGMLAAGAEGLPLWRRE